MSTAEQAQHFLWLLDKLGFEVGVFEDDWVLGTRRLRPLTTREKQELVKQLEQSE